MSSQNNALVEIALALAMVFFSIMVLAMVSMSIPHGSAKIKNQRHITGLNSIDLRSSSTSGKVQLDNKGVTQINPEEVILYFDGSFFDTDLRRIPETLIHQQSVNYLAVDPNIPTVEAIRIRKKFSSNSLAVTLLNTEWLKILKEKSR